MSILNEIEELIKGQMPESIVKVEDMTGTMDHLEIYVASDLFKGKMLLDQHQMIMDILSDELKNRVHAVKIKTMNLEKYHQTKPF